MKTAHIQTSSFWDTLGTRLIEHLAFSELLSKCLLLLLWTYQYSPVTHDASSLSTSPQDCITLNQPTLLWHSYTERHACLQWCIPFDQISFQNDFTVSLTNFFPFPSQAGFFKNFTFYSPPRVAQFPARINQSSHQTNFPINPLWSTWPIHMSGPNATSALYLPPFQRGPMVILNREHVPTEK